MCKYFSIMAILVIAVAGFADDIVTADGNSYKNVTVREVTPIGIAGTVNESGQEQAVWIPYDNMLPADQQRYGYDKATADAFIAKLNANRSAMDDGTVVSSPKGQVKDKSVTLPKEDANSPIQGNRFSTNRASGATPVIAGGINPQAVAVATPGTYSCVGIQQVAASIPGAGVSVAPSGIGINTPIGNIGISPTAIGVNTPVANVGISNAGIGVQTAITSIAITPGPVPVPMYPVYPAAIPVIGVPITAVNVPQPVYYTGGNSVVAYDTTGTAVVQYANPVVYNDGVPQQWVIYNGVYIPYSVYLGYYQSNWCYGNGVWVPASWYLGLGYWNRGRCWGWYNPCGYYRGRYWNGSRYWNSNSRGRYGYHSTRR